MKCTTVYIYGFAQGLVLNVPSFVTADTKRSRLPEYTAEDHSDKFMLIEPDEQEVFDRLDFLVRHVLQRVGDKTLKKGRFMSFLPIKFLGVQEPGACWYILQCKR